MDNCQLAFSVAENHFGFQKILKPSEMLSPDTLALFTYLSLFYEFFQNKEPAAAPVAPAAATVSPTKGKSPRKSKESSKYRRLLMASPPSAVERSWNTRTVRKTNSVSPQRSLSFRKKRQQRQEREKEEEEEEVIPTKPARTKLASRPKSTSVLVSSSTPETRPQSKSTVVTSTPETRSHSKSTTALQTTPTIRETPPTNIARRVSTAVRVYGNSSCCLQLAPSAPKTRPVSTFGTPTSSSDICFFCNKRVYLLERMSANGVFFHRACFRFVLTA